MADGYTPRLVFQAFWWNCQDSAFPGDWYTYLAKLCPRVSAMGIEGMWLPAPTKGASGNASMGYDPFDYYDLGNKNQRGLATHFGDQDALLRLIAVAHANGLETYLDVVLDHCDGGSPDPGAPANLSTGTSKKYQFPGFGGAGLGRWPRSWLDFHPNPQHWNGYGDWFTPEFGDDICYRGRCSDTGNAEPNGYMRSQARAWLVWLTKQTGADGYRFDDAEGYPPEVVEDLLYNSFGNRTDYFSVGEFASSQTSDVDSWAAQTLGRCGTFDFPLRYALADMVRANGFYDLRQLPAMQQQNRYKTVPFVNTHDSFRSGESVPLGPPVDPDDARAKLAYAVAFAVDGSPMVFFEDLFVNTGVLRSSSNPGTRPARAYLGNLIWCHQNLRFKQGAYKVRPLDAPDLLVIERSGRALIAINDNGVSWRSAWVPTDFGANTPLHDYSGSTANDLTTNQDGWVQVAVPPMSYGVWAAPGMGGHIPPAARRTTQEFQLDDDLGDSQAGSQGYGGKLQAGQARLAGAVYVAAQTTCTINVYTDAPSQLELRVFRPDASGRKRQGPSRAQSGAATSTAPLTLQFNAQEEGYHLVALTQSSATATRAYVKVEYEAPATSAMF